MDGVFRGLRNTRPPTANDGRLILGILGKPSLLPAIRRSSRFARFAPVVQTTSTSMVDFGWLKRLFPRRIRRRITRFWKGNTNREPQPSNPVLPRRSIIRRLTHLFEGKSDHDFQQWNSHITAIRANQISAAVAKCERLIGYKFSEAHRLAEALNSVNEPWLYYKGHHLPHNLRLAVYGDAILTYRLAFKWLRTNLSRGAPAVTYFLRIG